MPKDIHTADECMECGKAPDFTATSSAPETVTALLSCVGKGFEWTLTTLSVKLEQMECERNTARQNAERLEKLLTEQTNRSEDLERSLLATNNLLAEVRRQRDAQCDRANKASVKLAAHAEKLRNVFTELQSFVPLETKTKTELVKAAWPNWPKAEDVGKTVEVELDNGTLLTGQLFIEGWHDSPDEGPVPLFEVLSALGTKVAFVDCVRWRFVTKPRNLMNIDPPNYSTQGNIIYGAKLDHKTGGSKT